MRTHEQIRRQNTERGGRVADKVKMKRATAVQRKAEEAPRKACLRVFWLRIVRCGGYRGAAGTWGPNKGHRICASDTYPVTTPKNPVMNPQS
eukprot:scaffold126678_cov31-Tisochrysis_lutea.AAC.3